MVPDQPPSVECERSNTRCRKTGLGLLSDTFDTLSRALPAKDLAESARNVLEHKSTSIESQDDSFSPLTPTSSLSSISPASLTISPFTDRHGCPSPDGIGADGDGVPLATTTQPGRANSAPVLVSPRERQPGRRRTDEPSSLLLNQSPTAITLPTPPDTPLSSCNPELTTGLEDQPYQPLSVIPNEILSLIFEWGAKISATSNLVIPRSPFLPVQPSSTVPFQETVSQVCRLWRSLATHTPGLWTNILVPLAEPSVESLPTSTAVATTSGTTVSLSDTPQRMEKNFKRVQKRLSMYLTRSSNYPLDIILCCTKPRSWIRTDALINQLSNHAQKWRSLWIIVPQYGPILASILCHLRDLRAPSLFRLHITSNRYPAETPSTNQHHQHHHHHHHHHHPHNQNITHTNHNPFNNNQAAVFHGHPPLPTCLQGAMNLRHVVLDRIQFSWTAPFAPLRNLTTLELRFVIWPKYAHLCDLFAASPFLTTLVMHIDQAAYSFMSLHNNVTFSTNSNSHHNQILNSNSNNTPTAEPQTPILLPTLEKLVIRAHMDKEYVRPFLRLFVMPALEELSLVDISPFTWCQLLLHFRPTTTSFSTRCFPPSYSSSPPARYNNHQHAFTQTFNPFPSLRKLNLVNINHLIHIDSSAALSFPNLTDLTLTSLYSASFLQLLTEEYVSSSLGSLPSLSGLGDGNTPGTGNTSYTELCGPKSDFVTPAPAPSLSTSPPSASSLPRPALSSSSSSPPTAYSLSSSPPSSCDWDGNLVPVFPHLQNLSIISDPWLPKHQGLLTKVLARRPKLTVRLDEELLDGKTREQRLNETWERGRERWERENREKKRSKGKEGERDAEAETYEEKREREEDEREGEREVAKLGIRGLLVPWKERVKANVESWDPYGLEL